MSFSGSTWACHQRCGDYTHWRIVQADIEKVPLDDAPEGWGVRQREIEAVRAVRRAEIRGQEEQGREGAQGEIQVEVQEEIVQDGVQDVQASRMEYLIDMVSQNIAIPKELAISVAMNALAMYWGYL